jgi:hypothetical protein
VGSEQKAPELHRRPVIDGDTVVLAQRGIEYLVSAGCEDAASVGCHLVAASFRALDGPRIANRATSHRGA